MESAGQGSDTIVFSNNASVDVDLTSKLFANFESVFLDGNANLKILGNTASNLLVGNVGNNLLRGESGNDGLTGGGGNDTLSGGAGNDDMGGSATAMTSMSGDNGIDGLRRRRRPGHAQRRPGQRLCGWRRAATTLFRAMPATTSCSVDRETTPQTAARATIRSMAGWRRLPAGRRRQRPARRRRRHQPERAGRRQGQ